MYKLERQRHVSSIYTIHNENREHMHIKAPQMTSTFIPDVVTTPLTLHVMEDGCSAAPERDEFMRKKGTKMEPKINKLCCTR